MAASGMVIATEGDLCWVASSDGAVLCRVSGRVRHDAHAPAPERPGDPHVPPGARRRHNDVTRAVVIGDQVAFEPAGGGGVVTSVAERRTTLSRPGFHGVTHIMAANVDQLVIVESAREPSFSAHWVQRLCVLAARGGVAPLLVVNKTDLVGRSDREGIAAEADRMRVALRMVSALTGEGLDTLRLALRDRVSVMAGKSGVGKSALVTALYPGILWAKSGEVGAASAARPDRKGRHTTSASRLFPLPDGGHLGDLPGIRQLPSAEDDADALDEVFPEIAVLASACRFRDCAHRTEPGCAVRRAVEQGEIDATRYRDYVRLAGRG